MADFCALFPGQGSQAVGMGKSFVESDPTAGEIFEQVDRRLGYSLRRLCLEGPLEELTLTKNTQPAILTVSYIAYRALGAKPKAAAGHSLGEYTALVAAGALSFADAVELVHKRGRYMQEAVKPGEGKMIAILGPTVEEISDAIGSIPSGVKEIANINSPGQTVCAGDVAGIDALAAEMSRRGAKVVPLNVSAPFHCSLMKPAADQLAADLDAVTIRNPEFPVYANVTAAPVTTASEVRDLLKRQVCATVRWSDSMGRMLKEQGVTRTVEFGAGGVLSNLLKRIDKSIARSEVSDPDSLAKTRAALA